MNDLLSRGAAVLQTAESSLRQLMQTAVETAQYDRLEVLARWADQIARAGANGSNGLDAAKAAPARDPSSDRTPRRDRTTRSTRKRRTSTYPAFKRSGTNLVKLGWSKASSSVYEHRAPKGVLFALLRKMEHACSKDDLITMDAILPLSDEDTSDVPTYQVYVCLAWLRSIGVVKPHGRRGYTVLSGKDAELAAAQAWVKLPIYRS